MAKQWYAEYKSFDSKWHGMIIHSDEKPTKKPTIGSNTEIQNVREIIGGDIGLTIAELEQKYLGKPEE